MAGPKCELAYGKANDRCFWDHLFGCHYLLATEAALETTRCPEC